MDPFRNRLVITLIIGIFISFSVPFPAAGAEVGESASILMKMKKGYAAVEDYQTDVFVKRHSGNGTPHVSRFTYTFMKPEMVRIDFQSPHRGMVMIYPDPEGKVLVRPFPWAPLIQFRLDPDSSMLSDPSGQSMDQTHMGLLIKNIARSLTSENLGKPVLKDLGNAVEIRVLARDHFLPDTTTHYRFLVEKQSWLPMAVDERTAGGILIREIRLRNLRINPGISRHFFTLEE